MVYLVVGECPTCISEGHRLLRICGLNRGTDYTEINRSELRDDKLFENRADLYRTTTKLLYNTDKKSFIDLSKLELNSKTINSVKALANKI